MVVADQLPTCSCGNDINYETKCRLFKMPKELNGPAKIPEIPVTRCEMKMNTENSKPFSFSPRRLSKSENDQLKKLLNACLEKGILRHSDAEHTSAILLKKKRNWRS